MDTAQHAAAKQKKLRRGVKNARQLGRGLAAEAETAVQRRQADPHGLRRPKKKQQAAP